LVSQGRTAARRRIDRPARQTLEFDPEILAAEQMIVSDRITNVSLNVGIESGPE